MKYNRNQALQNKIQKRENNERERLRKQENFTNDIIQYGLWQSETEVDNMLSLYDKASEKIKALKSQMRFRSSTPDS